MKGRNLCRFDPGRVATPAYVVDEGLLLDNLAVLAKVKEATGCKILLALKCFAMFRVFPLLAGVLDGVCCSSPHVARLGREEFGRYPVPLGSLQKINRANVELVEHRDRARARAELGLACDPPDEARVVEELQPPARRRAAPAPNWAR